MITNPATLSRPKTVYHLYNNNIMHCVCCAEVVCVVVVELLLKILGPL